VSARCRRDFPGVSFALLDLRPEEWRSVDGVTVGARKLPGDPRGSTAELGEQFYEQIARAVDVVMDDVEATLGMSAGNAPR
jgi:hypothetical protein